MLINFLCHINKLDQMTGLQAIGADIRRFHYGSGSNFSFQFGSASKFDSDQQAIFPNKFSLKIVKLANVQPTRLMQFALCWKALIHLHNRRKTCSISMNSIIILILLDPARWQRPFRPVSAMRTQRGLIGFRWDNHFTWTQFLRIFIRKRKNNTKTFTILGLYSSPRSQIIDSYGHWGRQIYM